jgi:hypothetical protein
MVGLGLRRAIGFPRMSRFPASPVDVSQAWDGAGRVVAISMGGGAELVCAQA